jgi:hypothetical protein
MGKYFGTFTGIIIIGTDSVPQLRTHDFEITSVNKDKIDIDYGKSTLSKKNSGGVLGTLNKGYTTGASTIAYSEGPIDLIGTWSKSSTNRYVITGTYTSIHKIIRTDSQSVTTYPVIGTFEIVPDNSN